MAKKLRLPEEAPWYWVYFLECQGFVKIGRSEPECIQERLRSIATCCPFPMTFLGAIKSPIGRSPLNERRIHIRFVKDAVHSEWFKLTDGIRDFLAENRSDYDYELPAPKFSALLDSFRQAPRSSRKVYSYLFADEHSRLL